MLSKRRKMLIIGGAFVVAIVVASMLLDESFNSDDFGPDGLEQADAQFLYYEEISGNWHFEDGTHRYVQLNADGTFKYAWPDSEVSGQFQGNSAEFLQQVSGQAEPLRGKMLVADKCHLTFDLYAPDGSALMLSQTIHLNHMQGPETSCL